MSETTKLCFHIANSQPVALADLTLSLLNVSNQYRSLIKRENLQSEQGNSDLYIKEVKTGSIIVELISLAPAILPLLPDHANSIIEFAKYLKESLEFFLGNSRKAPIEYTLKDCNEFSGMLNPIANDHGSNMNVSVINNGTIIFQHSTNSVEANAIQNAITKHKENLRLPESNTHSKEILYWHQAQFKKAPDAKGDKAIIEKISAEPLKVSFASDVIKEAMTTAHSKFKKDWQDLAYIVDVEVGTIHGKPKWYKITNCYDDETFDPNE